MHLLAEESRQTFLYSLLDQLNSFSEAFMLVFSTKNIFFDTKLEKRVKSRFTHISWHFYHLELEDLIRILKLKVKIPEHKNLNKYKNEDKITKYKVKTFQKIFEDMLDRPAAKQLFEKFLMLGASVGWFVNLLKSFSMFVDSYIMVRQIADNNDLLEGKWWSSEKRKNPELKIFLDNMSKYLITELVAASDSICFEFHNSILLNLPKSMHNILLVIQKLQLNSKDGIKFEAMLSAIQSKIGAQVRGGIDNYSTMVIKDCLLKLEKMRILHINRIPIVLESVILLLIPSSMIENIKLKDKLSLDAPDEY